MKVDLEVSFVRFLPNSFSHDNSESMRIMKDVPAGAHSSPNFKNFVSRNFKKSSQRNQHIERLKLFEEKVRRRVKV